MGKYDKYESLEFTPNLQVHAKMIDIIFSWDIIAPFGVPVVPEV